MDLDVKLTWEPPTHEEVVAFNSNSENFPWVMTEGGDRVIDSNEVVRTLAREILASNWSDDESLQRAKEQIFKLYGDRIAAYLNEQLKADN